MFSCQWHSEFRFFYMTLWQTLTPPIFPKSIFTPSYSKATKMKGSVTFLKPSTWIHIRMLQDFLDGKVMKSQVDSRSTPDLIWSWSQQICEKHVFIFITSSSWNPWKDDFWYITSPSSTSSSSCPISLPHVCFLVCLFACPTPVEKYFIPLFPMDFIWIQGGSDHHWTEDGASFWMMTKPKPFKKVVKRASNNLWKMVDNYFQHLVWGCPPS